MMEYIASLVTKLQREEGQSAVEYGVILALILAICVGAYFFIGTYVSHALVTITTTL